MKDDELEAANYEYWLQVRDWDSNEAASLLLGIEPRSLPLMLEDQSPTQRQATQEIRKLRRILSSAVKAGDFGEVKIIDDGSVISPAISGRVWVAWARLNSIECSVKLSIAVEQLEKQHSSDDLIEWLGLDLWTRQEFACLSCDINPTGADISWHGYRNAAGVKINKPRIINAQLLSEGPFFYITPVEQITQEEHDEVAFELAARGADVSTSQVQHSDDIERKRHKLATAEEKLQKIWLLICRTTDLELEAFDKSSPRSYLEWAQRRGIKIPWLEWATQNNLVEPPKTEAVETNNVPEPTKPSDKRREEGLRAAIAILRQEHASGKLRAWQEFERCMRKVVVINYIRKNPTDFPHCAKIKPILDMNEGQSIKDREPTLTKSFPDFTKTTEIVDEYERLTREK